MNMREFLLLCTTSMTIAGASIASAQAPLKSPVQVKQALGTLNRVVGHTQRLIDAKNYARLPHENAEFKEGIEALDASIAGESAQFKSAVATLIDQSRGDSQSLADAAQVHDPASLAAAHAALADAVKSLVAAFPAEVRPSATPPAPASP